MLINIRVYKANKGNRKAEWLPAKDKHKVIDEIYEVGNGNQAYRRLFEDHPEIKKNWEIKAHVMR